MKYFSKNDIKKMIKNDKIILLVDNIVYDFTNFNHPFNICFYDNRIGKDVSYDYQFHSKLSQKLWNNYKIGKLKSTSSKCTIM